MGSRITRAAPHLPKEAIQQRMHGEQRLWRRQRWEIIYGSSILLVEKAE
jgi:hypothetical protein